MLELLCPECGGSLYLFYARPIFKEDEAPYVECEGDCGQVYSL